jgi:hypothetical protein
MSIRDLLETTPVDRDAEERAWQVVREAHAAREPQRRPYRRVGLALVALGVAIVAASLSPPGRAVVDQLRRSIGIEQSLLRLPAPGRVLVSGAGGTWVVAPDGSKRRLGDEHEASWSPHGLYVIAVGPDGLVAMTPHGDVHWTLARHHVSFPRWAGRNGDTRIAYLAGSTLRVVAGDGTGDRLIARHVAHMPPVWLGGDRHRLEFVLRSGRAVVYDLDRGALVHGSRKLVPSHALVHARSLVYLGRTLFVAPAPLAGLASSPNGRWLLTTVPATDQWVFVQVRGGRVVTVSQIRRQFGGGVSLDGWAPGA